MNPQMIKKMRKMQEDMQAAQKKIEETEYVGKATGVVAVVQGTRQLIDLQISDDIYEEKDLLIAAIIGATNDALNQIDKAQNDIASSLTGNMGFGF